MGRQRRRRQPGAGRCGLQGLPGGQVQHGRLGGGGAGPRDRAVRAPLNHGHRCQPRHVPHQHHAPAQRRGRQRRHRLHGHLLPPLLPRRLPRRLLPRPVPHHRHLRPRPSHRHGAPGGVHGGAAAAPAAVWTRRGWAVRAGHGAPDGRPLRVPLPHRARHRRAQVQRLGLRHRSVRRARRPRARRHGLLLQPLLLLYQRRHAPRRHRPRLRPGPRRPELGLRHLRRRHARRHRRLSLRHQTLPLQAQLREPHRTHPPGPRLCRPEAEHQAAAQRLRALRGPLRARAHPSHRPVPVLGQGGRDGRRRRQRGRARRAAGAEPVEAVLRVPRGGGEDGGAADAGVGDDDPVLDHLRADDHLLRGAGDHHGPAHGRVRDPGRLAHRLLRRSHHAHPRRLRPRVRPALPEPHDRPAGAHQPGEDRHRPCPLHLRHGRRRHLREEAPRRRGHERGGARAPSHQRVHADAAVPAGGRRRGLHLHGAAGLLHHPVTQGHEDDEHGPLPHHALARLLPQQRACLARQGLHAVARRHHQPQPPRLLLLAARRAQRRQPGRLPRLRHVGHAAGEQTGGATADRDDRRREMLATSLLSTSLSHQSLLVINIKISIYYLIDAPTNLEGFIIDFSVDAVSMCFLPTC